jgi:N-acetylglucosamine malate deacetylase 1
MFKRILVIAAHPDDEVLGCGGTIAKFAKEGVFIHIAFIADGVFSREENTTDAKNELQIRREASKKACDIIGAYSVSFDDYPDNRLDTVALLDITKRIESLIDIHQPDTVFTHHGGDVNIDHQRVHQAMIAACRPQIGNPVKNILCYEVPSSTEWQLSGSAQPFVPNFFIDISNTLKAKLEALKTYSVELRNWPHPRSVEGVEALARWRGATIGTDAAEAFILCRGIL